MPDNSWKVAEREAAKLLGGERRLRHIGGVDRGDPGDVVGGHLPGCSLELFVEVKKRKKHGILKWFKIADEKAPDRISLLFLRQEYDGNQYVVIKWKDLEKILQDVAKPKDNKGV